MTENDALKFVRLLEPIYSAIFVHLCVKPEEKMSESETKGLIQLFGSKIQGLLIGCENTFAEFHRNHANVINDLVFICIYHGMTEQV